MSMKTLYFSFAGRIGRKQYWINYVLLFSISITVIAVALTLAAGATQNPLIALLNIPVGIVAVWGSLAMTVKRFHDRDKKGWWVLIGLVPVVGSLWLLIENGFLKGTDGSNRFGDDPLQAAANGGANTAPVAKSKPAKKGKSAPVEKTPRTDSPRTGFAAADALLVVVMVLGAALLALSVHAML